MDFFAELVPVFLNTLLPVFLVAGAGFLLAGRFHIDARSTGRILFYLCTPSLVFRSLYQMEGALEQLQHLAVITVSVTLAAILLGWLAGWGQERQMRAAITLTSGISNNGNMGMPIALFAFGQAGLGIASVYFVVSSMMSNTLGVFIGSAGRLHFWAALRQSFSAPVPYAAVAGLLCNYYQLQVPTPIFESVNLLANAAVPIMLVVLGVQLHAVPRGEQLPLIARPVLIRLVVAPLLSLGLCILLGVTGLTLDVFILQAAVPTAVMTSVLATEFEAALRFVAAVVFYCTVASMVTLSVVLTLLR